MRRFRLGNGGTWVVKKNVYPQVNKKLRVNRKLQVNR